MVDPKYWGTVKGQILNAIVNEFCDFEEAIRYETHLPAEIIKQTITENCELITLIKDRWSGFHVCTCLFLINKSDHKEFSNEEDALEYYNELIGR